MGLFVDNLLTNHDASVSRLDERIADMEQALADDVLNPTLTEAQKNRLTNLVQLYKQLAGHFAVA